MISRRLFCGIVLASISIMSNANAQNPTTSTSRAAFVRTGESPILAPGATMEKLAGGFAFTEGPAADKDGNVYFVDQPNNRIMKYDTDGKLTEFLKPSNYSNGMTFDREGMLIACADEKNELWRIDPRTGQHTVLMQGTHEGKRFNGPNDVWVQPTTGRIYFTDPYYQRDWWTGRTGPDMPQSVYYFNPTDGKVVRLADDLVQPNGIIGTPDGKQLYVADIRGRKTYVYDIQNDGTLANKKLFCEMGSDGMTIDNQGNVYLTSRAVQVFDRTGQQIDSIPVPESPANVCFGGKDHQTLFITARTGLYAIKTKVSSPSPQ